MKNVFSKIKSAAKNVKDKISGAFKKIPTPKFIKKLKENEKLKKVGAFLNKYAFIAHIPLSMAMCFVIEWLSRHSFVKACSFVVDHPAAFFYNSYLIFVIYSLCFLWADRMQNDCFCGVRNTWNYELYRAVKSCNALRLHRSKHDNRPSYNAGHQLFQLGTGDNSDCSYCYIHYLND